MHVEERFAPGGDTIGWMLHDDRGGQVWCGELQRAEFLALPREHQDALRDDLGWYLVEIGGVAASARHVLARVSDESAGLRLARAYLLGRTEVDAVPLSLRPKA